MHNAKHSQVRLRSQGAEDSCCYRVVMEYVALGGHSVYIRLVCILNWEQ